MDHFIITRQAQFRFIIGAILLVVPAQAIKRTIGPPNDERFINASQICNGSDPKAFEFRTCSLLIDCIYDNITEAFKASLGSGTSIAALLPTILALIGAPPLEIVQLALVSPHRALATCCFSIGLPSGLFRQLRPLRTHLSNMNSREPRVREWTIPLPSISEKQWKNLILKLAMDVLIMSLASIMLWRNWVINSFTMVPWRCEYSWLVFAWPIACMLWLVLAVILVLLMKESIDVYDSQGERLGYTAWSLLGVPYIFAERNPRAGLSDPSSLPTAIDATLRTQGSALEPRSTGGTSSLDIQQQASGSPSTSKGQHVRTTTMACYDGAYIRVCITMPSNFGWRSWRSYEAAVESMAVGIYLYATFVLTSLVYLNADKAIVYATVMALCLSAVRILTTLF